MAKLKTALRPPANPARKASSKAISGKAASKSASNKTASNKAASKRKVPPPALVPHDGTRLERLAAAIDQVRAGTRSSVRTSRLLASGTAKMAQKVIEEAAEVAIEGLRGDRRAIVSESVDLFYNLLVLLSSCGVSLDEVWAEMDRRETTLGMSEKLPKTVVEVD